MQNIRSHTRLGKELYLSFFIVFMANLYNVVAESSYVLTVEPASCVTSVRQGESCVFKCDVVTPAIVTVTWTKQALPNIYVQVQRGKCTDVPAFPSDYVSACAGQYYTLNITKVRYGRDNYPWICTDAVNHMRSNPITLHIKVFPKGTTQVDPPDVKDGQTANVNCTTSPYYPAITDGYIAVGGVKYSATYTTTRQAGGLYVTVITSTFVFLSRSSVELVCVVVYDKQTLELFQMPLNIKTSDEMRLRGSIRLLAVISSYWYYTYVL